jgi:hypothetical protein
MQTFQCPRCKWRLDGLRCLAFPKAIPYEILTGQHDHTKEFKGDNGVRFEPTKDLPSKK